MLYENNRRGMQYKKIIIYGFTWSMTLLFASIGFIYSHDLWWFSIISIIFMLINVFIYVSGCIDDGYLVL